MSSSNLEQNLGSIGPALLDHNQILVHQFNTTGQIPLSNHVRAGT